MIKTVDNYELFQCLGKGNYGEVYLTRKNHGNELFATKKMDRKLYQNPNFFKRLVNELNILMQVKHPNIVKYVDLKITLNNYYLVTEYINGGSLESNLKRYMSIYHRPFSEEITQYLMKQIVDVVKYLHFNNIIHRDLKLDNILVKYPTEYDRQNLNLLSCQIKLIDFGFARTLGDNKLAFTMLGTPYNMDPSILKVINGEGPNTGYNEKVDIWSLGTLCYEMVVGCSPFRGTCLQDLYQNVKNGDYILPGSLSEEIVSFINKMLKQDENQRADAKRLLSDPFLVNPVSSFHPIDVRKIKANYLPGGLISMNSKEPEINKFYYNINNQYDIWTILSQPKNNREALSTNPQIPNIYQFQTSGQVHVQQPGMQSYYTNTYPFQYQ